MTSSGGVYIAAKPFVLFINFPSQKVQDPETNLRYLCGVVTEPVFDGVSVDATNRGLHSLVEGT